MIKTKRLGDALSCNASFKAGKKNFNRRAIVKNKEE